jgi:hypothetical protein
MTNLQPPLPVAKSGLDSKKEGESALNFNFENLKTPLDSFSLEKSRNTRLILRKNNCDEEPL